MLSNKGDKHHKLYRRTNQVEHKTGVQRQEMSQTTKRKFTNKDGVAFRWSGGEFFQIKITNDLLWIMDLDDGHN